MKEIIFENKSWNTLQQLSEQGYPKEVCGLLLGIFQNGSAVVQKIEVLENVLDGQHSERLNQLMKMGVVTLPKERALKGGGTEFFIDPMEHSSKILLAQKEGLDQVGVFHSHPDHPATPSSTDASQPMMAGWSSVIVKVDRGNFVEARSWYRENEENSFQEENIVIK